MQHSDCGGTSEAPFSPSGIVAGRWNTHRLSCESTASPPTCPVTHLFGNACDQSGSGSNRGTCDLFACAAAYCSASTTTIMTTTAPPSAQTLFLISLSFLFRASCALGPQ